MRKTLAAMALATSGLAASFASHAAVELPTWDGDPKTVAVQIKIDSCSRAENGQRSTFHSPFMVVSERADWDKAIAGKSDAEVKKKLEDFTATSREVLQRIWSEALAEFTPEDTDEPIPGYGVASTRAWTEAGAEITKKTGFKTFVGFEGSPDYTPGCTLK